jgi:apolipoprotein N-acyltransferase
MRLRVAVSPRDGLSMSAAAFLGALAFPPFALFPLSLVSISLFLRLIRDRPVADARPLGVLYGLVYALTTMYWLFGIFGPFAISLIALMAAYFGLLATLIGITRNASPLARAALAALFAVAVEWLRGDAWYLRFPWYTPPHALAAASPCIATVRWIGTYGLSYFLWFIAAVGAYVDARYWLAFFLIPTGWLFLAPLEAPTRRALLLQAEEPEKLQSLIAEVPSGRVDLTVLPEYAFPYPLEKVLIDKHGPTLLCKKLASPVVFGTVLGNMGEPDFRNVAAVLDGEGKLLGTFQKQRPVPLMLDGPPGTSRPVFRVAETTLGIGICYDFDAPAIAASLVRDGATVLVVPTCDLMMWSKIQHVHHELLVRLRAVENDRWILRAASSGRSEAVDPHGVPSRESQEIGKTGYVQVAYGERMGVPPGGQASILGPVAGVLTILVVLWHLMNRSRIGSSSARRGSDARMKNEE